MSLAKHFFIIVLCVVGFFNVGTAFSVFIGIGLIVYLGVLKSRYDVISRRRNGRTQKELDLVKYSISVMSPSQAIEYVSPAWKLAVDDGLKHVATSIRHLNAITYANLIYAGMHYPDKEIANLAMKIANDYKIWCIKQGLIHE